MSQVKTELNKRSFTISPPHLLLLTLFLLITSYANSLYSPFVFDDFHSFIANSSLYLKDLSFGELQRLLGSDFGKSRIIPIATFAIEHYLGRGQSITIYHITNIAIHLTNTVLVALLATALLKTDNGAKSFRSLALPYVPIFIATIWALSPVQTSAVTYLVQRMASLAALFYFAAILFYLYGRLSHRSKKKYIFFCLCMMATICAFFSKENSATIPVTLFLIEIMFIGPDKAALFFKRIKKRHYSLFALTALLLLPLFLTYFDKATSAYAYRHFTLSERLLTESRVIIFYISLLLFPDPQRMALDHDINISTSLFSPPSTIFAIGFIISSLVISWTIRKKNPLCSFGIFFFFLNLAIESTVIPLELIFEHRLYLPTMGFAICLVCVIDYLFYSFLKCSQSEIRQISIILFVIIASLLTILTALRNDAWRSYTSIYQDSYTKYPGKARTAANYAVALGRNGKYEQAIDISYQALANGKPFYEDDLAAINNILVSRQAQGKHAEALAEANSLLRKVDLQAVNGRDYPKLMENIAESYLAIGDSANALQSYVTALQAQPDDEAIYQKIAEVYSSSNKEQKEDDVFFILAQLAYEMRQYEKALSFVDLALTVSPTDNRLLTYKKKTNQSINKNQAQRAIADINNDARYKTDLQYRSYMQAANFIFKYYPFLNGFPLHYLIRQALKIAPDNNFALLDMARWYMLKSDTDTAINILQKGYAADPSFFLFQENLFVCYQQKSDPKQSSRVARSILASYHGHPKWRTYKSKMDIPPTTLNPKKPEQKP